MAKKLDSIFLVDGNSADQVMGKTILSLRHNVTVLPSAEKLFEALSDSHPNLILLEVKLSGMSGFDAMTRLKAHPASSEIPVIFLTTNLDEESELKALNLGAVDYITKPYAAHRLLKRVENQLIIASQRARLLEQQEELKNFNDNMKVVVRKTFDQVYELQNAMLSTVAEMVEFRDNITGGHITRTQRYLSQLVTKLISRGIYLNDLATWDLNFLLPSAQLHDVGKIAISDQILNKPARLTEEEFEIMKRHTTYGVQAIERIEGKTSRHEFLIHAKIFAGTHHEKWDGTGYPNGMKGTEIPLQGRIMAIADVYDALIARRPYKEPMPIEKAEQIICEGAGSHFDPQLVEIFRLVAPEFASIAQRYWDEPVKKMFE